MLLAHWSQFNRCFAWIFCIQVKNKVSKIVDLFVSDFSFHWLPVSLSFFKFLFAYFVVLVSSLLVRLISFVCIVSIRFFRVPLFYVLLVLVFVFRFSWIYEYQVLVSLTFLSIASATVSRCFFLSLAGAIVFVFTYCRIFDTWIYI